MFLGWPFSKLFAKFWSIQKHGSDEWGLLALYGHEKILKKSSSQKPLVWFWNNFTGMFLGWPFSKMFTKFWSVHKHGSGEWGLLALYGHEEEFLENLLLRNRWSDFEIISLECSLCDPFKKLFAKFWSVHKYGSGEWGLFALYRHEEILKKSFSQNSPFQFWNNFTGMFLGWPSTKSVCEILIRS